MAKKWNEIEFHGGRRRLRESFIERKILLKCKALDYLCRSSGDELFKPSYRLK